MLSLLMKSLCMYIDYIETDSFCQITGKVFFKVGFSYTVQDHMQKKHKEEEEEAEEIYRG